MKKILTLCVPYKNKAVLLGMKKRGFGEGRWNGFGGKINKNESIEEAAKRELSEEAGIKAKDMEKVGVIEFHFQDSEDILETHFFRINDFQGELIESEEMKPQWFNEDEIPFNDMWPDDKFWMPLFLENKKFKGYFLFDRPSDTNYSSQIIDQKLEEVKKVE